MKIHTITFILLIIGGLNWGLKVFDYDIGSFSFIPDWLSMLIYILVALSAIYEIFTHKNLCRNCNPSGASM